MSAIEKVERLTSQLRNVKAELAETARIGTNGMLCAGGGLVAGYLYAKFPTVPNSTFPTAAALGSGLLIAGLANVFEGYSDQVASLGSGLLAVVVSKESEAYFRTT